MELNLLNLVLILIAAWTGGSLATRLGYPAVLGELLVGIVCGPPLLGWFSGGESFAALNVLAQVGVLLLMLYIGMEIDPSELGKASWGGLLAAIGGFVTPFVLGYTIVVYGFGAGAITGIFIGIAVGVTSLATKSRILLDLKILDTRIAHVMLAGALIADTISLVVFAGVLGFTEKQSLEWWDLVLVIARVLVFFACAALVGIYGLPFLFRRVDRLGVSHRGVYFFLVLIIAFAFGESAELAGLHAILGTFAAGLFLREGMLDPKLNRDLHELVRDVSVGFLAPIFFVMAGFEVRLDVFQTDLALFFCIVGVAFVGKIVGTVLFYLPTGNGWREGVVLGAGMNDRGAVEIILAGIGLKMGLISQEIFSILVFMAILTTASVPFFLKWGVAWLGRHNLLVRSDEKRRVTLIVGAGPTARALASVLRTSQPVWLIDGNAAQVEQARAEGHNAVHGNALDVEALVRARASEAGRALCMTGNVEINLLAARFLRDTFAVPALHVPAFGSDAGATNPGLDQAGATMLFDRPLALGDWDHWFSRGSVDFEKILVDESNLILSENTTEETGARLILALERQRDGKTRILPFHSGLRAETGDRYLMAVVQSLTGTRDQVDEIFRNCPLVDLPGHLDRQGFFDEAARILAGLVAAPAAELSARLHERETLSSTVLTAGLAVPHIVLPGRDRFAILVARAKDGVLLDEDREPARALFVLAVSEDRRNFHLRMLSAIAQIWQSHEIEARWLAARGPEDLRELLLSAPRQRMSV